MTVPRYRFPFCGRNVGCSWRGAVGTHPSLPEGRNWCDKLARWKIARTADDRHGVRYACDEHAAGVPDAPVLLRCDNCGAETTPGGLAEIAVGLGQVHTCPTGGQDAYRLVTPAAPGGARNV